jgi:hypothetical protein
MPWNEQPKTLTRWYATYVRGEPIAPPHLLARLRKAKLTREMIANPSRYLRDGRQHTARTLFQHYTNSEVLRADAGRVLVEAITDHFAAAVGPTILPPDAETLLRQGAAVLSLDAATTEALLAGELDGALTACRNPDDSPHAPAGTTCPMALSGLCFTCPNAIITRDHLPALILIDQIADPARGADQGLWQQVWQPIHHATRQILRSFPAEAVTAAAEHTDPVLVEPGLRNDLRGVDA